MPTGKPLPDPSFQALFGTEEDARRLTRQQLLYYGLIYGHFGICLAGWLPYWTLLITLPILVIRWMLAVHELFHLRTEKDVDFITALLPLMLTPLSLGYREFLDIHRRHHQYMATPEDPEYFQIRGSKISGFLNALTAPEQAWFRWVIQKGIDGLLLKGMLVRFILFAGMIVISGWHFLWYWIPVRLSFGAGYFAFFYWLHRKGNEYSVYALNFSPATEKIFEGLFGREALLATCHHDMHHAHPRVNALHLPETRL